ncbi:MAG: hypothetical protein IPH04_08975 [Saprospirales bacterium]|nr:hypothetical protein [Saprospirales bacterium]
MLKAASILLFINAFGFGLPCLPAIRNALAGKGIPYLMGFPAYGNGPFERHGIQSTAPLLAGFLLMCILEGFAGIMLWNGNKIGAYLALALLPFGALYWWGFALPFGPIFALVRTILIALAWSRLQ